MAGALLRNNPLGLSNALRTIECGHAQKPAHAGR
ncbi:hypothetical protein SAMN05421672_1059 [Pseudomonas flexibilis]|uniref:Uncharacterized protein n=1 Tax=Pseudomonas flexibilis TaxID=706570 RepID=A0A1N6RLQ2_9PSED|nr:hypothetical protein SAMN05421672_1059 [Pseudomonas flexibilis]